MAQQEATNVAHAENVTPITNGKKNGGTTLSDVARVSEMKDWGYLAAEDIDGGWYAEEIDGVNRLGPASDVKALHTLVSMETQKGKREPKTHKISHDSKGQGYIPGTEPVHIPELTAAVTAYHEAKNARMDLSRREKTAKDDLIALFHKHEDKLESNGDGGKMYIAGDIVAEVEIEEKEKIKTRNASDEDE